MKTSDMNGSRKATPGPKTAPEPRLCLHCAQPLTGLGGRARVHPGECRRKQDAKNSAKWYARQSGKRAPAPERPKAAPSKAAAAGPPRWAVPPLLCPLIRAGASLPQFRHTRAFAVVNTRSAGQAPVLAVQFLKIDGADGRYENSPVYREHTYAFVRMTEGGKLAVRLTALGRSLPVASVPAASLPQEVPHV